MAQTTGSLTSSQVSEVAGDLVLVVRKLDNFIHFLSHYPAQDFYTGQWFVYFYLRSLWDSYGYIDFIYWKAVYPVIWITLNAIHPLNNWGQKFKVSCVLKTKTYWKVASQEEKFPSRRSVACLHGKWHLFSTRRKLDAFHRGSNVDTFDKAREQNRNLWQQSPFSFKPSSIEPSVKHHQKHVSL